MIPLILTAAAGYLITDYLAGDYEGHPGKLKSVRIRVKQYILHVHHWLSASFALYVLPSDAAHKTLIEAFLVGIIIQGLTYKDFYKVIYKAEPVEQVA